MADQKPDALASGGGENLSATQTAWRGAGCPRPAEKFAVTQYSGICSTCATTIDGEAVAVSEIDSSTFSGRDEAFRFGGTHVCLACGWLYGIGKSRPGNYLATLRRFEQTVISLESVVEDKRPWLQVLEDVAALPGETLVTGVLTTDVKPRLWHRTRTATVRHFGLYIHAPEYDASEWRYFDLRACLEATQVIRKALALGYTKASCFYGLLRDFARASRDPAAAIALDAEISPIRTEPHFLPALIISGITKEEKNDIRNRTDPKPLASTATRDTDHQAQFGLL
jgi:hypothetical protein